MRLFSYLNLLALLSLLSTTVFTGDVFADDALTADTQPSYVVAIPFIEDVPPYQWRDRNTGKIVGSVIDAHALMAEKLGYNIRWRFYNPVDDQDALLQEFQRGEVDIFINAPPKNFENIQLTRLDAKMMRVNIHAFAAVESPLANQGTGALNNYRGISTTMVMNSQSLMQGASSALQNLTYLPKSHGLLSVIKLLQQDKADFSLGEHASLTIGLRLAGASDQFQILNPPVAYITTWVLYKPSSDFSLYHKAFVLLADQYYNNGRFKHIRQRNMRQYVNQTHNEH